MKTISAYPLEWPTGWKRTPRNERTRARFSKKRTDQAWGKTELSVSQGASRVVNELSCLRARDDFVISTNIQVRLDGLPYSDRKAPDDPGVAVYWTNPTTKRPQVMAIDIYDRVADNLAAIAATLDAMRAIERHGGAQILERAFTSFTALPAPISARHWTTILGVNPDATPEQIDLAYKRKRSAAHSDHGGSDEEYHEVERAYQEAIA